MEKVRVWEEITRIPTYEIGAPEKNPIFLEKRVYQGSCGKVYPYPTIEKISDVKRDKEYKAVYLENEYLKIMVLPQLGGRIQRAYDKTNGYDFIYYNQVIKPALVGLTGPWISGGIEFNWPQHHRPTTFLPVDYELVQGGDGSCSILCHDVDQMYGTKGITKITLYPGKAYIEISGQLYNRTPLPQTFLWWANPAVAVNDDTQSVFPPDVHAVMDHGKRDVSRFPIATGIYYKHDYSEGVDISRYRNIPVPTSYMAEKSNYDFVGGYDYGREAGILHVADHHISPGKKQWTWGCGDFGKAWDRNLTDEDGPYIELMTGVFTDNQPDFTWLKPFEEKTFTQYFMPYKKLGYVKNASREAAVNLELAEDRITFAVYATERFAQARIVLQVGGQTLWEETATVSPLEIYEGEVKLEGQSTAEDRKVLQEQTELAVYAADGRCLVKYRPEKAGIHKLPEPAHGADCPEKIRTNEELYLTGQHIEQYRHATYLPDPYYLEGLKRDPGDIRINNAYGALLLRRGLFAESQPYFEKALERLTYRNPNPYNSESYYLLGLCLFYQGKEEEAYDAFYKATWSNEQQEMSFYYLAVIDARRGRVDAAYEQVEKALVKNAHNIKARALKAYLLRKSGCIKEAENWLAENLKLDPFDFVSGYELSLLSMGKNREAGETEKRLWKQRMRGFVENYLMAARDYGEFGAYEEALMVLGEFPDSFPMIEYTKALYRHYLQDERSEICLKAAENCSTDYCFPNKLEDIRILRFAIENGCRKRAPYYLGCLYYDRLQWKQALELWEMAAKEDDSFPTVFRNLALVYYNKCGDGRKAKAAMERAYALDEKDTRVFLELDQLYRKLGYSPAERLENYENHSALLEERDDLYTEYITLLNLCGQHEKAYDCMLKHHFHPWEGGEGKITTQYVLSLLELSGKAIKEKQFDRAKELLCKAFSYPENLGEGKLEGTKDNHINYYLGFVLEAEGKQAEAEEYFRKATIGTDEPAGALFYNDQPADMILYQGLSFLKLGKTAEAKARFYRLIDYGEQHLEDEGSVGYFAVSLPDFLIFEEDYTKRNRVHCLYLMALGNLGIGEIEKAKGYLQAALALEPSHIMCNVYERMVKGMSGEWKN